MASVSLKNVKKIYKNRFQALYETSINIEDKEFIVIVGPSGCGKTTILRMIAGLEDITHGEIFIDNRLVNKIHPKDRNIAMVFQDYALYPHMTVWNNMAFDLKMRNTHKNEIKGRIEEVSNILHIKDILNKKPNTLSGGQKQRIALGRAIVREPNVFLFDEPLSNLDAKLRLKMRAELSRLHQKLNTTMIYVTHDQTEAMTMGDRIVVMNDGVIQQIDTPKNIYSKPNNKFVADFIGSPPMNILEMDIDTKDGELIIYSDGVLIYPNLEQKYIIEKLNSDKLFVGFRPEDLQISKNGLHKNKAKIDLVEQLGSGTILYLLCNSDELISSIKTDYSISKGDNISFNIPSEKCHFFDINNNQRLN